LGEGRWSIGEEKNPYLMMIRTICPDLGKMFRKNHIYGHKLRNVNQWMPLSIELYQKMLV